MILRSHFAWIALNVLISLEADIRVCQTNGCAKTLDKRTAVYLNRAPKTGLFGPSN
jgi:hypothetical protein